jgi:glycine oxidase
LAERVDVAVVGAGIVGLGIAWTIAESGRTVTIVDPAPARGATFAAAGMLAPVGELCYEQEHLLEIALASAGLYPIFIDSLGTEETTAGYQKTRTITVGSDAADRQTVSELHRLQLSHNLPVAPLTIREACAIEPFLNPRLACAFTNEQDAHVNPRRLAQILESAIATKAAQNNWTHPHAIRLNAVRLLHESPADMNSRVTGITLTDGSTVHTQEVIIANGCASPQLDGLPEWLKLPLRPVHGDILRLRVPQHLRPLLTSTIRGIVGGVPLYLVPRPDGTLVLGATQRENGSAAVSAGGIHQLLRDAHILVPATAELELIETTARARPTTPDNAPLIGRVGCNPRNPVDLANSTDDIPGLIIATGFFRHGVLLMPVAGQICLQLLDGVTDPRWHRYRPDRFSQPRSQEAHHD